MNGAGWRRTLVTLMVALLSAACGTTANIAGGPQPPGSGELRITTRTDREISGTLGRAGAPISFTSRLDTSSKAVLQVIVDGHTLTATLDQNSQTGSWEGGDRAFSASDREGLEALDYALTRYLNPFERDLPLHEHLLHRMAMFWSEAPVGLPLARQTVRKTPESRGSQAPPPGVSIVQDCRNAPRDLPQGQACQQSGQDGITYLPCNANVYLSHDAAAHCFVAQLVFVGPSAQACLGRCGSGCGPFQGRGLYTKDCGDHDQCCREHGGGLVCINPLDGSCGDEWSEAFEDFLFAQYASNCRP